MPPIAGISRHTVARKLSDWGTLSISGGARHTALATGPPMRHSFLNKNDTAKGEFVMDKQTSLKFRCGGGSRSCIDYTDGVQAVVDLIGDGLGMGLRISNKSVRIKPSDYKFHQNRIIFKLFHIPT